MTAAILTASDLTPSQAAALKAICDWLQDREGTPTAVLTGYAGTGKTTLMRLVVEHAHDRLGRRIAVTAPTHKALNILREKIGAPVTFSTIQSLLGMKLDERDDGGLEGRFGIGAENIRNYNVVVCDECSMLNRDLLAFLGRIMRGRADLRVLFVGDPAQLPPVVEGEDGPVGLSPVFEAVQTQFCLTEIVRQAADNPIIRIAGVAREAQSTFGRCNLAAIDTAAANSDGRAGMMRHSLSEIADACAAEIEGGVDARIVAFTNKRVIAYNEEIHTRLFPDHKRTKIGADYGNDQADKAGLSFARFDSFARFEPTERLIVQEQSVAFALKDDGGPDFARKVSLATNEELTVKRFIGCEPHPKVPDIPAQTYVVERASGEDVAVIVPSDSIAFDSHLGELFARARATKDKSYSREAWAKKKAFASIRHAYAITSHKAQGSTFHTVFVDWPDMMRIRDHGTFNRALYVAITRASTHLAIAA